MTAAILIRVALPVLLLAGATPRLLAQDPTGETVDSIASQAVSTTATQGLEVPANVGGLPERPTPPPTMAARWPVFVVLALAWLGILARLLGTGRRAGRLARRIGEVEEGR